MWLRHGLVGGVLGAASWVSGGAVAEAVTYDFADPKGVNGVMFVLDSEVEPFVGIGGGVTGEVVFDAADPKSFSGSISVDAGTLTLVNSRMTDVMQGDGWLNLAERPEITATFDQVIGVGHAAHDHEHDHDHEHAEGEGHDHHDHDHDHVPVVKVLGTLKFGSVSLAKVFEIEVTLVEDGGTARGAGQGDLLVLRSEFTVNRFDLGITDESDKVSPEIRVVVPIVGYVKPAE